MVAKTYKTKEKAAAALGLTVAQLDVIGQGANAVYQEIGYDLAAANGGRGIRRNALIEVVLDANRLEQHLEREKEKFERWQQTMPTDRTVQIADVDAAVAVLKGHGHYAEITGALKLYFTYAFYE